MTISAISPYSRRSASPGTGTSAGGRAPRRAASRTRGCVTRLGRGRVDRPAPALVVERREHHPDADPRGGSTRCTGAAGDRAADAEPERRQHLRERAAVAVEHDAGAHLHHAHARARGRRAASASHSTHTSARKSRPGGRVLVERLFAVRAVVADRRGADQRARAPRRIGGRAASPSSRLRVPIMRLSRIARLACALQRCATGSPARCTTASRPASAAAGAGSRSGSQPTRLDRRRGVRARARGIAREHRHLRAALAQRGDERGPISPSPP